MAFPVVESHTYTELAANELTISATVPSGTVEGDLLVAFHNTDGDETHTATGWNEWDTTSGVGCTNSVWWIVAPASVPSTYDFTSGSTEHHIVTMFRISGADTTTPITGDTLLTNASTTLSFSFAFTTSVSADHLMFHAFCSDRDRIGTEDTGYASGHTGYYTRETNQSAAACGHGVSSINVAGSSMPLVSWSGALTAADGIVSRAIAIQPAEAGEEFFQTVAGNMPNPTGAVVSRFIIGMSLSGSMPAAAGGILKRTSFSLDGDMPTATGNVFKKISINLSGDMPTATGNILKKILINLAGVMPTATGVVTASFMFIKALVGNMPNATGGLIKKTLKNLVGFMPATTGDAAKKTIKNLDGTMPNTTGDVLKETSISLAGDMPASTGEVAGVFVVVQAVEGNMPTPTGGITKKVGFNLSGDMPTTTGAAVKKTSKSFEGNMPASAGENDPVFGDGGAPVATPLVEGNMPAPSGEVTVAITTAQALEGSMPTPTGGVLKKTSVPLSGNMPTTTGTSTKKTGINLAGDVPTATGVESKKQSAALEGDMPTATGNLNESFVIKQSLTGTMGAIAGVLAAVKTVGTPFRSVVRLIGASFRKFLQ